MDMALISDWFTDLWIRGASYSLEQMHQQDSKKKPKKTKKNAHKADDSDDSDDADDEWSISCFKTINAECINNTNIKELQLKYIKIYISVI